MRRIRKVYLAGPSVYYPHAAGLAAQANALCEAAGLEALTPEIGPLTEQEPSEVMAREIYAERAARMRSADAAIVDLTPFRGPQCDPAAAFEAGFLAGLGRPLFAYMNVSAEEDAELCARVQTYVGAEPDEEGVWRDIHGAAVEDYGLPESLMLWSEARRLYVVVTPDVRSDLTGLHLCLEALKLYAE